MGYACGKHVWRNLEVTTEDLERAPRYASPCVCNARLGQSQTQCHALEQAHPPYEHGYHYQSWQHRQSRWRMQRLPSTSCHAHNLDAMQNHTPGTESEQALSSHPLRPQPSQWDQTTTKKMLLRLLHVCVCVSLACSVAVHGDSISRFKEQPTHVCRMQANLDFNLRMECIRQT